MSFIRLCMFMGNSSDNFCVFFTNVSVKCCSMARTKGCPITGTVVTKERLPVNFIQSTGL